MSKPRKPFQDHSARWKREALRDGLKPQRWNRWLRLSPMLRTETDPRGYAAGRSLESLITEYYEPKVIDRMMTQSPKARLSTITAGVQEMTPTQLRWTMKAPRHEITRRARRKYPQGVRNPWWYQ